MIFLAAGHHPNKPGARCGRFCEYDEACAWIDRIVKLAPEAVRVVPPGVLKQKVAYINTRTLKGDSAVEIHFNAAKNSAGEFVGRGSETLYYPGSVRGEVLASQCQGVLGQVYPPDRGVKEGYYRMDPTRGPDFFLAQTNVPAVILEPEFIHREEQIKAGFEEATTKLAALFKELSHEDR